MNMMTMSNSTAQRLTFFGKTCLEYSPTGETLSDAFLLHWPAKHRHWNRQGENGQTLVMCLDPAGQSHGSSKMPNISAWPNAAAVCSLSQVLETGPIPEKYFLSSKACAGILRRAEKRGRTLPEPLREALVAVAERVPPPGSITQALTGRLGGGGPDDNKAQGGFYVAAFGGNNTAGSIDVSPCLNGHAGGSRRLDFESEAFVAYPLRAQAQTLRAEGFDASEDGTGRVNLVPVAFHGSQDPDVSGDVTHPCGRNNGLETCVAFAQNTRNEVRLQDGDGKISGALSSQNGMKQQTYVAAVAIRGREGGCNIEMRSDGTANALRTPNGGRGGEGCGAVLSQAAVRRLTHRECERLQGFPEIENYVRIRVWPSEIQKNFALAGIQNPRLLKFAKNVEEKEYWQSVQSAKKNLPTSLHENEKPVVVNVLYDCERKNLQIHNQKEFNLSVNFAESENSYLLHIHPEDFVRLLALMPPTREKITPDGKAELQQSIKLSSLRRSGNVLVHLCGQEIDALVNDAEKFTMALSRFMKFTTSEAGKNSLNFATTWETWCSCVVAAISGFIQEPICSESSFDIVVKTTTPYTLIEYRGKPAADGPRYKALGNSKAVPVVRWILNRITRHLTAEGSR